MPSKRRLEATYGEWWKEDQASAKSRYFRVLQQLEILRSITYHREEFVNLLSTRTVVDLFLEAGGDLQCQWRDWRRRVQEVDSEVDQIIAAGLIPGVPAAGRQQSPIALSGP